MAEYLISCCYFPKKGEVEGEIDLTWERLSDGKSVEFTVKVTEEEGKRIAEMVPSCVYHSADLDKEDESLRELYRLTLRAGRRVTRDLRHAADSIPDEAIRQQYLARWEMWRSTFLDTEKYRDELHLQISHLEARVKRLEKMLRDNDIDPDDIPF